MRPRACKIVSQQEILDGLKRNLGQEHLGCPIAHPELLFIFWIGNQSMCVGTLDAVHPPWIFGLGAVEEGRCSPPAFCFQIGYFEGVQVAVLRVRNLGLASNWKPTHGNSIARVCVGGNCQSTSFRYQFVCC